VLDPLQEREFWSAGRWQQTDGTEGVLSASARACGEREAGRPNRMTLLRARARKEIVRAQSVRTSEAISISVSQRACRRERALAQLCDLIHVPSLRACNTKRSPGPPLLGPYCQLQVHNGLQLIAHFR